MEKYLLIQKYFHILFSLLAHLKMEFIMAIFDLQVLTVIK